jgi:hypothetical protein
MNAQVKVPLTNAEIVKTIQQRQNELAALARDRETATARAQPHRREFGGSDDRILGTPLGRFCQRTWSDSDPDFRKTMYNAGNDYAMQVREARAARGHYVDGPEADKAMYGGGDVTEAAIEEARERIEIADAALKASREALMAVGYGLRTKEAVERLVCSDVENDLIPAVRPNDEGILKQALYRLALHYGLIDRGINTGKVI